MSILAQQYLNRLFEQAESHDAGIRKSPPRLTARDLAKYRDTRSLAEKEDVEATLKSAQARDAILLQFDDPHDPHSQINRVEVSSTASLADFLQRPLRADAIKTATCALSPWMNTYPVLADLLEAWTQLKTPRGTGPGSIREVIDAIKALENITAAGSFAGNPQPLRVVSQTLFNDSKRIESLSSLLDILLVGSLDMPSRHSTEIWQELGLLKEEQPALLAGKVMVARSRVCALLDAPYTGLPAPQIQGLEDTPIMILSIENLTTFHIEARARCDEEALLLYTGGMPSPQWRAMYRRILASAPPNTPIYHWGDIDEGGFRIAAKLAEEAREVGQELKPWDKMRPEHVPQGLRVPARSHTVARMSLFAKQAGWAELAEALLDSKFTAEQEAL